MLHGLFVCTIGWTQVEHLIVIKDYTPIQYLSNIQCEKCGIMDWLIMMHGRAQGLANYQNWISTSAVCLFAQLVESKVAHTRSRKASVWFDIVRWKNIFSSIQRLKFQISALRDICRGQIYLGFQAKQVNLSPRGESLGLSHIFHLTSRHTNISFGHYKRGLYIGGFFV